MSLPARLEALYTEWRALTEAENEAITAAAWSRLADVQTAKSRLQPDILSASAELEQTRGSGPEPPPWREPLSRMLSDLIDLEARNQTYLGNLLDSARQNLLALDRSSHNLRRLQRSYTASNPGVWERYS